MSDNIIIITGFSGTGKSRVGRAVAQLLGWEFVDTDAEVVRRAGKPISRIFRDEGEDAFRRMEREALQQAVSGGQRRVVATGAGAIMNSVSLDIMDKSGFLVCLEARPETIYQRLRQGQESTDELEIRPLLQGTDPLTRIRQLKAERQPAYAQARWTVHTDALSVEEVAQEVARAWRRASGKVAPTEHPFFGAPELAATVEASSGSCPLLVGWGLLPRLGELLHHAGIHGPLYVVTDDRVGARYMRAVQRSLQAAEFEAHSFTFPNGEKSKSLEMATRLYAWLAHRHAQRGHTLVALGGGVVGDLTGFVAATYNRGMGFVQVPTSMAAMMDASIGGKTAVNLPEAKNLVGAFYQPRLVVADVAALKTLPPRETMEGWAEAIKHGLILDAGLFRTFEEQADQLLALESELTTEVIRRSMAIKARVVSEDERETTGYRTLLNYGHTIGHGLEAATEYGTFLHGEGVSIGMMGAATIGQRMGVTPKDVVERQEAILRKFNLPVACPGVDLERVEAAMALDKKAEGASMRWVLLEGMGRAVVRGDVPQELVRQVLRELAE
ncbi:MAG: 3-dehydroquinate synthase [Dehalococcoidia bacterium]|nr:3-dehydroquinate synthase [Dehalococcoidia bacterium]